MDSLPPFLRHRYKTDFSAADAAFFNGRLASTTDGREKYWKRWKAYVAPLGLDPYLQATPYEHKTPALSGLTTIDEDKAFRTNLCYYLIGRMLMAVLCSGDGSAATDDWLCNRTVRPR